MILVDAGHIYGFLVHNGVISISWDDSDVVTIPYKAGASATKADAKVLPVFSDKQRLQVSYSSDRSEMVVMENLRSFVKRSVADVTAGIDNILGTLTPPDNGTLQGFSVDGDVLRLLYGSTDEVAWIENWSFSTQTLLATLDITDVGFLKGETPGLREPEGMIGNQFAVKLWQNDDRRIRCFKLINF